MRRIILGIALLVLASGLWKTYSVRVHQSSSSGQMTDPTLLSNRIKKAKAGGITEVVIPAPVPYLAEVSSLDEAVTHYSVIVGKAIDATSIQVDGSNIMTYYRFRILERLSDRGGPFGGVPEEFPRALAPLGSEEIYILEGGGTVTIDGVKVKQKGEYEYTRNEKYLLFIAKNSSGLIGLVSLGKYGVFKITDDTIEGIVKERSPLNRDLSERASNKITNLRAAIKRAKDRR